MLTLHTAQTALQQHAQQQHITALCVANVLNNAQQQNAQITYVTNVKTSAKCKDVTIKKVTQATVTLYANANAQYTTLVKQTASAIPTNNANNVQNFTAQENYFEHTNCYSVVQHKQTLAQYLYALFNNAQTSTMYFINNTLATKQDVAQYLTPAQQQQLFNTNTQTHNATHNITHNAICRTIALNNIVSITAV